MADLQPMVTGPLGQDAPFDPAIASAPSLNASVGGADLFEAAADAASQAAPTATLGRMTDRSNDTSSSLSAEDANAQFGVQGPTPDLSLSWKPGQTVQADTAQQQQQLMQSRIQDSLVMARRPSTLGGMAAAFGGDLLGTLADPLNIASSFLPVSWFGRGAEVAADAGKLEQAASAVRTATTAAESSWAGRTTAAAIQNAAGVALTQPILMAGADADHSDYSFASAAQNVLFGGLLGAGLHGIGEGLSYLAEGSTARGMVRAAASSMTGREALSPLVSQDMMAASRGQVADDLRQQTGAEPTEEAIATEMQNRQTAMFDKKAAGEYDPTIPTPEPFDEPGDLPDKIGAALDQGDYESAAFLMEQHTNQLQGDVGDQLRPEDSDEINTPTSTLETVRNMISDFTDCVAQEATA